MIASGGREGWPDPVVYLSSRAISPSNIGTILHSNPLSFSNKGLREVIFWKNVLQWASSSFTLFHWLHFIKFHMPYFSCNITTEIQWVNHGLAYSILVLFFFPPNNSIGSLTASASIESSFIYASIFMELRRSFFWLRVGWWWQSVSNRMHTQSCKLEALLKTLCRTTCVHRLDYKCFPQSWAWVPALYMERMPQTKNCYSSLHCISQGNFF